MKKSTPVTWEQVGMIGGFILFLGVVIFIVYIIYTAGYNQAKDDASLVRCIITFNK